MFDIFYIGEKPNLFPFEIQVKSLEQARKKSRTKFFWLLNGQCDYTNFNFHWLPPLWEQHQTHVFPSQWQRNSGTMFCPKHVKIDEKNYNSEMSVVSKVSFENWTIPPTIDKDSFDFSWHPDFDDIPYIYNFPLAWQRYSGLVYTVPTATDLKFSTLDVNASKDIGIHYLENYNEDSKQNLESIKKDHPDAIIVHFVDNYLDTLKRTVANATTEYIWVISSLCDYSKFDFNWRPDAWQQTLLHVFPTGDQKYGDTFYIHVPSFLAEMKWLYHLRDYGSKNFCTDQSVTRFDGFIDVVQYDGEAIIEAFENHKFMKSYALFYPSYMPKPKSFDIPLWERTFDKLKAIYLLTESNSVVVAPREIQAALRAKNCDFMTLLTRNEAFQAEKDLDIVYISNGEPEALRWYNHLKACAPNQTIHWAKDVKGRSAAYKEAARLSTTPWFLAVFAKLEVNPEFDWKWQPNRFSHPQHYIFNAKNPTNGLIYGHQAMLAYNKKLVLETDEHGLDFTLSQKHSVVELLSGVAHFAKTPKMAWRTAFRECLKLRAANDADSKERLRVWTTVAEGENAEWCLRGANDAVEYFESVSGEHDKLMLSFDWEWLDQYFQIKNLS